MCIVMLIEYTIHLCMARLHRFQSLCDETFAVCDKILLKASSHRDYSHRSRVWFIQVWSLREWHLQASIKNHPVMINSQPDWISVVCHSVLWWLQLSTVRLQQLSTKIRNEFCQVCQVWLFYYGIFMIRGEERKTEKKPKTKQNKMTTTTMFVFAIKKCCVIVEMESG